MPKSKKTTVSATVTKSAIDHATSILEDLPEKPKENWSLREAVAHLQVQISSALSKGYSYEEVARMLTERGIEISASSLKSYLSAAKRQKETAPSKTERTGRRSRKALSENLTVIAADSTQSFTNGTSANGTSANGTSTNDSDLNGAKQPIVDSEPVSSDAPAKLGRRTSTKPSENGSSKQAASKTAAKAKSAPRTKSTAPKTASKETPTSRGKRKRQA